MHGGVPASVMFGGRGKFIAGTNNCIRECHSVPSLHLHREYCPSRAIPYMQLPPGTDISGFLTGLLTKTREFEEHKKVRDNKLKR